MKRLIQLLERLFKSKEQPEKLPPLPPYKPPLKEPMAGVVPLPEQKFDSELPEIHPLRAVQDDLRRWGVLEEAIGKRIVGVNGLIPNFPPEI